MKTSSLQQQCVCSHGQAPFESDRTSFNAPNSLVVAILDRVGRCSANAGVLDQLLDLSKLKPMPLFIL